MVNKLKQTEKVWIKGNNLNFQLQYSMFSHQADWLHQWVLFENAVMDKIEGRGIWLSVIEEFFNLQIKVNLQCISIELGGDYFGYH